MGGNGIARANGKVGGSADAGFENPGNAAGKGPNPARLAGLEGEFKKEEEKVLSQKAELDRLLKERRHKEKELEEETERVKKTEARVFEIKTNKEYQAVLKEIEGPRN